MSLVHQLAAQSQATNITQAGLEKRGSGPVSPDVQNSRV